MTQPRRRVCIAACTITLICAGGGNPLNFVIAFNNRGNAYLGKRDYERAIADYRKALSLKIDEPNKKQIETALGAIG